MKLKPLEQWICDVCREVIESPEDGYVQFHQDSNGYYDDFIIVHHYIASPLKDKGKDGCYKYKLDTNLSEFLGANGVSRLLSKIDIGAHIAPEFDGPHVSNFRKWVEFFRRLQTPYYEEARLYWDRAKEDDFFVDANEFWPYLPENLKLLIEKYGDD